MLGVRRSLSPTKYVHVWFNVSRHGPMGIQTTSIYIVMYRMTGINLRCHPLCNNFFPICLSGRSFHIRLACGSKDVCASAAVENPSPKLVSRFFSIRARREACFSGFSFPSRPLTLMSSAHQCHQRSSGAI